MGAPQKQIQSNPRILLKLQVVVTPNIFTMHNTFFIYYDKPGSLKYQVDRHHVDIYVYIYMLYIDL